MERCEGRHRRSFLQSATLAGLATWVAGELPGAHARTEVTAANTAPDIALEDVTVTELQERMTAGTLTAHALTAACLARIAALDAAGPELHSVIETNPEALEIARALDDERRAKGPRGPLHGIPVLLKDNIDTADRMETTAGSLALAGSTAPRDAFVAERLRAAGAILLGKANMSEWANFRSTRSTSGWSARGGQCRNPYVLDRNPCGSSSGSAVAVAAGLAPLAVGTETDGSIVCPSSLCGIVGLKPTVGLVSRAGIIPISHTQDTAGPMTRTVRDAALLLTALAGVDPRDVATTPAARHAHTDYTRFLEADGLRGARLGVWRADADKDPRVTRLFEQALAELKRRGATLVDPVASKALGRLGDPEGEVLRFEFKADLEAYLRTRGPNVGTRTLKDLIAFNEAEKARELAFFGQEIFEQSAAKGPLPSPDYRKALATCQRLSRAEGLDTLLSAHKLDALVAPTGGPAWLTDLVNGDHFNGIDFSTPAAVAGYPHITVPMGFVRGLPIGLSFAGPAWSEPVLLRLAYAFELATRARRPPTFLPTVDLALAD